MVSHREIISRNMGDLVEKIDLKRTLLWDKLVQYNVIPNSNVIYIKESHNTNRDQVRDLLVHVSNGPEEWFDCLKQALIETNQKYVVSTYLTQEQEIGQNREAVPMSPEHSDSDSEQQINGTIDLRLNNP